MSVVNIMYEIVKQNPDGSWIGGNFGCEQCGCHSSIENITEKQVADSLIEIAARQQDGLKPCGCPNNAVMTALRHSAESHESLAIMLEGGINNITLEGVNAMINQCRKYAAEARRLLEKKV